MKKIVLSVAAMMLMATGLLAQATGGIRGGLNIAGQKISAEGSSYSFDKKIGFQLGLYMVTPIAENVFLQPELVYSDMGAKEEADGGEDVKFKMGYISIPLFLRYNVTDNFNIHAGPQAGFLISAKASVDGDSEDIKSEFKDLDFGFSFGAGLDFDKFNCGLRYYAGIANISDLPEFEEFDAKWKNNAIQIFLGYRLFGE